MHSLRIRQTLFGPNPIIYRIVAVALVLRLLALALSYKQVVGDSNIWKTGPEIVNIATAVGQNRGFSSPFAIATGPTAWIPPVYPFLLSLIFRIAGTRTQAAALCILALQILFSALTCIPLYFLSRKAFGDKVAVLSSFGWALFPYSILMSFLFIWETTLSTLLLSTVICLTLEIAPTSRAQLAGLGLLWGIAGLTNTALLSVMPFSLLWIMRRAGPQSWRTALLVLLVALAVLSPWIIRDAFALGTFVPVRSNFGEELWLGNFPGGHGRVIPGMNPQQNARELESYRALGELAYVHNKQREALDFIRREPWRYLSFVEFRVLYWWFAVGEHGAVFFLYALLGATSLAGIVLSWRDGNAGFQLITMVVLIYPLVYYATDVYARYRYPVEPLLMALAANAVYQATRKIQSLESDVAAKAEP